MTFSYTLNQAAAVEYVIYRRDGSPQRRACPRIVGGHSQDTFTRVDGLNGSGVKGKNSFALAAAKAVRTVTRRRLALRRTARAGRQRVSLAAIAEGRALKPGTYVLLVTATNAAGQRSATAHVKFFVLAKRSTTAARPTASRRLR